MSKKFEPKGAERRKNQPDYDVGDPDVQAKAYQLNEKTPESATEEHDRRYSFSNVSTSAARSFLHPPDRLIAGRVIFKAKYLGYLIVQEPKGTAIVKAAVDKLKVAAEVTRINNDEKIPEVNLSISIRSLGTENRDTKERIHLHSLPLVSFSADMKQKKNELFAYIAKSDAKATEYVCYAYEVGRGQGKLISATVGQAFELAFRKFKEDKELQKQFSLLREKLAKAASDEERESIKKEMAVIQAKKAAEEERIQRVRDSIRQEVTSRGTIPVTKALPEQQEQQPQGDHEQGASTATNGVDEIEAEVEAVPAPAPVWKRGFDVALNTLEQQIKELEEAFEWRKEMEKKQKTLLGKQMSDSYLSGIESQVAKMGN